MFAQLFARPAAMARQQTRSMNRRRVVAVAALGLLAAACTATAPPLSGADPSDATVRVPAMTYRSVLGGYVSRRPVEPAPWREQNERVAPKTE